MSFNNIPAELKELRQWVVWRLEKRDAAKPTKVPYAPRPGGMKASVSDSAKYNIVARDTWGTFAEACAAPLTCSEPVDPSAPVEATGFSGIGFVFTKDDPYCGIDLDDTHGDEEAYARQVKVFREFDSYAELSPSGAGLHIFIKAKLECGRRRADIELYPHERFFTMTGNVFNNKPIEDRQDLAELLFEQMGGAPVMYAAGKDQPQTQTDEQIIAMAVGAVNGEKFNRLYTGDFQSLYPSQSEADFALVDIIAFYTQNMAQIARIFRGSALGQRDKAQRDDYIGYMVNKSFDRQLPKVDIDGLRIAFEARQLAANMPAGEPGGTPADMASAQAHLDPSKQVGLSAGQPSSHSGGAVVNPFPPGLIGEVAQFLLDAAPRQVPDIALAGAIGLLSGICGRGYNVSNTGINQYILLLAPTGTGKDLIASGTSKLMAEIVKSVPAAADFRGPGELVSSAGLIKWLDKKPACYSILGEFGVKLKEMADPRANAHLAGLERILLQLYSKSGNEQVLDPMAYSDSQKNTSSVRAPAFTMLGESVPERFYEMLDDTMISSGLLPRFMTFEYKGQRPYLNEQAGHIKPSFRLVQQIADLAAQCLTLAHNGNVFNVPMDEASTKAFREFDRWTTDQINDAKTEVIRHLWNRAQLKALKLAALCAVGINMHSPIITMNETMWATTMIVEQTRRLIVKFETGQIGHANNAEGKQLAAVVKCISEYLNEPHDRYAKYQPNANMHRSGVIPESYVSRRLISVAVFRNDRRGSTAAIKLALKTLCESDELREVPKAQMVQSFGCGPRAYVVANASRFLPGGTDLD